MNKGLEKILYVGLGISAITKEMVVKTTNQLIEKGKLTEPQAKELVDRMVAKVQEQAKDLNLAAKEAASDVKSMFSEDVASLKGKVNALAKKVEKSTRLKKKKLTKKK